MFVQTSHMCVTCTIRKSLFTLSVSVSVSVCVLLQLFSKMQTHTLALSEREVFDLPLADRRGREAHTPPGEFLDPPLSTGKTSHRFFVLVVSFSKSFRVHGASGQRKKRVQPVKTNTQISPTHRPRAVYRQDIPTLIWQQRSMRTLKAVLFLLREFMLEKKTNERVLLGHEVLEFTFLSCLHFSCL